MILRSVFTFGSSRGCTDQAVKQFQKANGLDVDGIVGVDTWRVFTGAA